MRIPILKGTYLDGRCDFRDSLPRNLVPIAQQNGISEGYLRPADRLVLFCEGPGTDRGGINWNGSCYRVMGDSLVRIAQDGAVTTLGSVAGGSTNQVTFAYSFDRLAIAAGLNLYYWDGATLTQVTDPDLGNVLDVVWVDGYFLTTDGQFIVQTDLSDPTSVNPLKYGSAEANPDPIQALVKIRNEVYVVGRYTVEVFTNVGGEGFAFARIEGAQIEAGSIGTYCAAKFGDVLAFMGGGFGEKGPDPTSIYLGANGRAQKIATREIDLLLADYSSANLAQAAMDVRIEADQEQLLIHLTDQTLCYDAAVSRLAGQPIWFRLDSGLQTPARYRARNLVRCYDRWLFGDPDSNNIGTFDPAASSHYDQTIGWEFGTTLLYNEAKGAVLHDLELIGQPGNVPLGVDPTVWTSYSRDGRTWSQERPLRVGLQGQYDQRLVWRRNGRLGRYRMQRFRGTSQAYLSVAAIEATVEGLTV